MTSPSCMIGASKTDNLSDGHRVSSVVGESCKQWIDHAGDRGRAFKSRWVESAISSSCTHRRRTVRVSMARWGSRID